MKRGQVITALVAAAGGAAIIWSLLPPRQAPPAYVRPSAAPARITSISAHLHLPNA